MSGSSESRDVFSELSPLHVSTLFHLVVPVVWIGRRRSPAVSRDKLACAVSCFVANFSSFVGEHWAIELFWDDDLYQ